MKKLLTQITPLRIAILSLLMVTLFLRYYLFINSAQLIKEFKTQNFKEIYSMNSLEISSRLNSLSNVINWVCLEGSVSKQSFYKIKRGECKTSIFQQHHEVLIPETNRLPVTGSLASP